MLLNSLKLPTVTVSFRKKLFSLIFSLTSTFLIYLANATMPMNLTESQLEDSYKYEVELVPILEPTALRMDPLYSIYFNWFRFISIGVIPFGLLVSKPRVLLSSFKKFQMPRNVFKYEEKCSSALHKMQNLFNKWFPFHVLTGSFLRQDLC